MKREPITLVTIVQVLIACAVAFGLDLDAKQTAALIAVAGVMGNLVARNFTWSQVSVEKVTNTPIEAAEARLRDRTP